MQLLDVPVNRTEDPRAQLYIVDYLPPGTTIQRRVKISNKSKETQHIEVYAAGATIEHDTFVFEPDRTSNELTDWTSMDPPTLDLRAGGVALVRATIQVPDKASAGERYGVIWATVSSASYASANVTQVHRVGVRVYLDVGPGGEPASDFEITNVRAVRSVDGQPSIVADVHNTGARALDITGSLSLSDGPDSVSAGPYRAATGTTLAIGDTASITVPVGRSLAAGPWTARLALESGIVKRSVTMTVTFPAAGQTRAAELESNLLPTVAISLGVLLIVAALLVLVARRNHSRHN
ncbi:MAG: hypothetical protein QOE61_192 [Micromonosporaceae bacterium]|nr:hypothetical protein [Micromonosporaceae bacterium]